MLTISPVLKDFPRNHLHGFAESLPVGLERRVDGLGQRKAEILDGLCHLSGGLFAEILRKFFNMTNARIDDFPPGDFLDGAVRHVRSDGDGRPIALRRLQLPHHIIIN